MRMILIQFAIYAKNSFLRVLSHNIYCSQYFKGSEDIDLFRGAANSSTKGAYPLPSDEGWDMATATPLFKRETARGCGGG